MAHFAKLDENNIVTEIIKVGEDVETSNGSLGDNFGHVDGETYCNKLLGGNWKQYSQNTRAGVHYGPPDPSTNIRTPSADQSKAKRANAAFIGGKYNTAKDRFEEVDSQYASWTMNDTTGLFEPPVPNPNPTEFDGKEAVVYWRENDVTWGGFQKIPAPGQDCKHYKYDVATDTWNYIETLQDYPPERNL